MGDVVYLDVFGDGGLFPLRPEDRRTASRDERTPGQRRRDRQQAAVERGQHPLSVALRGPLPLLAVEDGAERPTCGTCLFRKPYNPGHARSFPKCLAHPTPRHYTGPDGAERIWTEFPRVSNGEGTDVLARWPACIDYLRKPDPDPKETR